MIDVEAKIKEIEPRFIAICSARNLNANEQEFVKALAKTSLHVAILLILKSLWHDASEEPQKGKKLVGYDLDGYSIYCWTSQEETWREFVYNSTLEKWCYIDDILPKEGGEGC